MTSEKYFDELPIEPIEPIAPIVRPRCDRCRKIMSRKDPAVRVFVSDEAVEYVCERCFKAGENAA